MDINIIITLISMVITLISVLTSFTMSRLQVKNERGTHISKQRFDKEFEIYQELSEKNLTAVYDAGTVVPIVRGMYDDEPEMIKNT